MKQTLVILTLIAFLPLAALAQEPEVQIAELLKQIEKAPTEEQAALLKKLIELLHKRGAAPFGVGPGIIVQLGTRFPSESMSGSWVGSQGEKGNYTLKTIGKGVYKLDAKITARDGTESAIKDEGKLPALHNKYPFLREFKFVSPRTTSPLEARLLVQWPRTKTATPLKVDTLGVMVRRPSPDLEYHLKLPAETTWIVTQVTPGTRADKLGIKRHDLLVGADSDDLSDLKTLRNAAKSISIIRRAKAKQMRISIAKEASK